MKIQSCLVIATICFFSATPARGGEAAQMRPLMIQGDWEVIARYVVDEKGVRLDDRDRDRNEWVRINRGTIQVFRYGKEKPTESFDIKIVKLADERVGIMHMTENGSPMMTFLYRFEGRHLLISMNHDDEGKPKAFASNGSRMIELVPYQHNRLMLTCLRPPPRPEKAFNKVAPPMPPNPPPVADPKK